ncbi:MAG: hypothetical protein U7127_11535 [Phormidium sp.]
MPIYLASKKRIGPKPTNCPWVNDPNSGWFKGPYGAIAQLTLNPSPSLSFGLTYVRSYNLTTGKGSRFANDPFNGAAISTNSYGLQATYQITPRYNLCPRTHSLPAPIKIVFIITPKKPGFLKKPGFFVLSWCCIRVNYRILHANRFKTGCFTITLPLCTSNQ